MTLGERTPPVRPCDCPFRTKTESPSLIPYHSPSARKSFELKPAAFSLSYVKAQIACPYFSRRKNSSHCIRYLIKSVFLNDRLLNGENTTGWIWIYSKRGHFMIWHLKQSIV